MLAAEELRSSVVTFTFAVMTVHEAATVTGPAETVLKDSVKPFSVTGTFGLELPCSRPCVKVILAWKVGHEKATSTVGPVAAGPIRVMTQTECAVSVKAPLYVTRVPSRQSALESSTLAQILVVALAGADLVIAIPTGPEPSVTNVNVRDFPSGSDEPSSATLLNVTEAIGAFGGSVGVGPFEGIGEVPVDGVGAGEPEGPESVPDGFALISELGDCDDVGDSPEVASRAPAAMINTTHATPSAADSLRQLVSFT